MDFSKYFVGLLSLLLCLNLQADDGQQLSTHIHSEAKPLVDKYTAALPFIEKGLMAAKLEVTTRSSNNTSTEVLNTVQFSENRKGQCAKGFIYIFSLLGFFLCLGYFVNRMDSKE